MSGDGKDVEQETADEVHPPCPPVELRIEESGREDDRGTELHGHGSSPNTINSKNLSVGNPSDPRAPLPPPPPPPPCSRRSPSSLIKQVPQACSIKLTKIRRGSPDQSMVESSHNEDRPPTPDADGLPQIVTKLPTTYKGRAEAALSPGARTASPSNEWFKMRTFVALEDGAVEQGGEAAAAAPATGNTGSGQGTSCWPFPGGSKKDSKN